MRVLEGGKPQDRTNPRVDGKLRTQGVWENFRGNSETEGRPAPRGNPKATGRILERGSLGIVERKPGIAVLTICELSGNRDRGHGPTRL
jgi:hypothetical protein